MYHSLRIEDGLGNLDKILPNRSNSFNIGRRGSRASNCGCGRRGSNWSSGSLASIKSPLPLDASDKKWFLASSQCQQTQLKELHGVDASFINKKDFFTGYSALHWASKQGKSELVHWLCDLGADVNLKSNGGYTPLHIAVLHGRSTVVDILITDYEADINIRDYSGRIPGQYAQTDTPNWVRIALGVAEASESMMFDAMSPTSNYRTTNLSVMQGRPVSRSWGSFKNETSNHSGSQRNADHGDSRENAIKSRTKSFMQSFRKMRNKDRLGHSREQGRKTKCDDRSRSVPDVSYTPRSKQKQVQIEHPHFSKESKSKDATVMNGTGNSTVTGNNHHDEELNERDRIQTDNENFRVENDRNANPKNTKEYEKKTTNVKTIKEFSGIGKRVGKEYEESLTDKNSNQWKISTMV